MPKLRNKFFTRSTLVEQLVPNPSEGRVRVIFGGDDKKRMYGVKTAFPGARKGRSRINGGEPDLLGQQSIDT